MKDIGNVADVCPYCLERLSKRPQRKSKCINCGKYIFVRTRPTDRKRVLVTEEQAKEIEAQWSEIQDIPQKPIVEKNLFDDEKARLAKKFGRVPPDNDIFWSLLNKDLAKHSYSKHWGLYRNTLFGMCELLRSESKWKDALSRYLEVCYLDLNGATNYGDFSDLDEIYKRILAEQCGGELKSFDPDNGTLYPGVLGHIDQLIKRLQLNLDMVRVQFMKVATKLESSLRLPVCPDVAWKSIKEALFGAQ